MPKNKSYAMASMKRRQARKTARKPASGKGPKLPTDVWDDYLEGTVDDDYIDWYIETHGDGSKAPDAKKKGKGKVKAPKKVKVKGKVKGKPKKPSEMTIEEYREHYRKKREERQKNKKLREKKREGDWRNRKQRQDEGLKNLQEKTDIKIREKMLRNLQRRSRR